MTARCCCCGRFCIPADSSAPFGSYGDLEPPEEKFYCGHCVEKQITFHIRYGWLPVNYTKANWEYEVAKVLGFIEIAPWSIWHKEAEPVPEGYEAVKEAVENDKD